MNNQQMKSTNDSTSESPTPESVKTSEDEQTYLYRHAGIEERHGHIPFWLTLVMVGLLIWSVYYTIRFWSSG